MPLQDYAAVLLKRWWVVAATCIVAALVAFGVSKLLPHTFRMQAVYLAVANRADNGLNIVLRNTMNSYSELVLQPDALEQISRQLQLDRSGEQLLRYVRVQPRPDEQKMVIEVDYPSAGQAQALAEAVGDRLEQEVSRLNASQEGTDRINVTRIQRARLVAIQPNTRINVLAGLILGLVLGILLAYILEFLDDTLKSTADIERITGLSALGAIPAAEAR